VSVATGLERHVELAQRLGGRLHPRQSESDPITIPARSERLRLTVKDLGNGSRLLQSIEVGTWVVAEGPYAR